MKASISFGLTRTRLIQVCPFFVFFLIVFTRLSIIFNSSDSSIVSVIPDDSFYYLKLACNFSESGKWSFDGVNSTSGFHLVYAYYLSFLIKLVGCANWKIIFYVNGLLACLLIGYAFNIAFNYAYNRHNLFAALVVALPFASTPIVTQTTANMESWLTIPAAILFLIFLDKITYNATILKKTNLLRNNVFLVTLFSFLMVLIRSDLFILLAIVSLNTLFLLILRWLRLKKLCKYQSFRYNSFDRKLKYICLYILLGSVIGLIFVFIHSYFNTGEYIQNSAIIKKHWSSMSNNSSLPAYKLLLTMIVPTFLSHYLTNNFLLSFTIAILVITSIALYIACYRVKHQYSIIESYGMSTIASPLAMLSYLVLYGLNSEALQMWYSAQLITPLFFLLNFCFTILSSFTEREKLINFRKFYLAPLVLLILWTFNILINSTKPLYINQKSMFAAISKLNNNLSLKRISGWNSGLPGYFSNNFYSNIDGLVNASATNFIISGRLNDYILEQDIDYIMDYRYMMTDKKMKLRGGYLANPINSESCIVISKSTFLQDPQFDVCTWKIIKNNSAS